MDKWEYDDAKRSHGQYCGHGNENTVILTGILRVHTCMDNFHLTPC